MAHGKGGWALGRGIVLLLLGSALGLGCAEPDDDTEAAEGAIQAGAANRSGLAEGVYDGESFSLEILNHEGRQVGALYDDDGAVTTGSFVDVSLTGKVTLGDSADGSTRCSLVLSTTGGSVYAKGSCAGKTVDELVYKRSRVDTYGKFLCSQKQTARAAELDVWRPEDAGLRDKVVTVTWWPLASSTLSGRVEGNWTVTMLSWNAGRWGFHLQRPNRLVWHENQRLVNGVPTNASGGVCRRAS